jgi:hypothetical protein
MKRCILYTVPVDLAYVKVFPDLFDFGRYDVVSCTPDTVTFRLALLFSTVRWCVI